MPDKDFLAGYVEVKDRIKVFYELYGQGRLVTDAVEILTAPDGKQRVMVRALAYRSPDDTLPAVGYSWMELPGTTNYTRGSEIENTETSAIGRAIGFLGILVDRSIASANEVRAKQNDDAPQADGGLIGIADVGKPPADFELRMGPEGAVLAFRLVEGRRSFKVIALGTLAEQIHEQRERIIGQRVECWGHISTEPWTPTGKKTPILLNILTLDQIKVGSWASSEPAQEAPEGPSETEVAGPSSPAGPAAILDDDPELAALPMWQEPAA